MSLRTTSKQPIVRALLAAACAFAGAALFGALVASALTVSSARTRPALQNPFDSSRSSQ